MQTYTKDDVNKVLNYFKYPYHDYGHYYVMSTFCHNESDGSQKLYAYFNDNGSLFYCYTNCGAMSLIDFVMKSRHYSYFEAKQLLDYVIGFKNEEPEVDLLKTPIGKLKNGKKQSKLKTYRKKILDRYYSYYFQPWIDEGISAKTQKKFDIKFSIVDKKIIIPQKNMHGRIVGVRGRALDENDIENFGKYHPETVGGVVKPVDTSEILYGLFENKKNIMKTKQAIVFEAEKSVMQLDTFFNGRSNAVALYGSNMSMQQGKLLRELGINELVVALDKEYQNKKEYGLYVNRLIQKFTKLLPWFTISLVLDKLDKSLLNYKDSPSDKGKEIFNTLMKERVLIE